MHQRNIEHAGTWFLQWRYAGCLIVAVPLIFAHAAVCAGSERSAVVADPDAVTLPVVYFYEPGCADCERVTRILSTMQSDFPEMAIVRVDIATLDGSGYNTLLCDRYGVPDGQRQRSPSLFFAEGYLVLHDITEAAVLDLLVGSLASLRTDRLSAAGEDLSTAGMQVISRARQAGIVTVLWGGLIDGVNPCAFAVLIFFVSYLRVVKRSRCEILRVGAAFIMAVFMTYFGLGLGLRVWITRLAHLSMLRYALTWLIIVFALALAGLNFYDAVLCARGRIDKISLQLPAIFKTRIRNVIRAATKRRHYIVAAFVSGVVVSLLELACTGQIYVPIILMISQREYAAEGVGLLLLYNAAFILPLVLIFGLAAYGLTHETLLRFMKRHAARVKFLTALFFLALGLLLYKSIER